VGELFHQFNPIALLTEHYPQFRRYGPTLLGAFEFHPAPVARGLIEAVNVLRQINRKGSRKVPSNAPSSIEGCEKILVRLLVPLLEINLMERRYPEKEATA
jgi:hypothetical protein